MTPDFERSSREIEQAVKRWTVARLRCERMFRRYAFGASRLAGGANGSSIHLEHAKMAELQAAAEVERISAKYTPSNGSEN